MLEIDNYINNSENWACDIIPSNGALSDTSHNNILIEYINLNESNIIPSRWKSQSGRGKY